jgi:hypothetical protein
MYEILPHTASPVCYNQNFKKLTDHVDLSVTDRLLVRNYVLNKIYKPKDIKELGLLITNQLLIVVLTAFERNWDNMTKSFFS